MAKQSNPNPNHNPNIPKTTIVIANTHGLIHITTQKFILGPNDIVEDHKVICKPLLDNMRLIKINATLFGTPNISTLENLNKINQAIQEIAQDDSISSITEEKDLLIIAKKIKKKIMEINKQNKNEVLKLAQKLSPEENGNYFQNYAHYSYKMFRLLEIYDKESYIDKIFIKFTADE